MGCHCPLGPPISTVNQKDALQTCPEYTLREAILQSSSLFPGDPSIVPAQSESVGIGWNLGPQGLFSASIPQGEVLRKA